MAEFLILYALWLLLLLSRPSQPVDFQRDTKRIALLGVLCGLTWTTRVTDGAALTTAVVLALPIILTSRRLAALGVFLTTAVLTVLAVVLVTGDSLSTYASNSIFRAAAAKAAPAASFSRRLP